MNFFYIYLLLNKSMQVVKGTSEITDRLKFLFFCDIITNVFQNESIEINVWNLLIFTILFSALQVFRMEQEP